MSKYNERQILLMQFNNNCGEWKDVTSKIQWYKENVNYYRVKYYGNETFYNISWHDIEIYQKPVKVKINGYKIYYKDCEMLNVSEIIRFDIWYKVFFESGNSNVYAKDLIKFRKNLIKQKEFIDFFDYLTKIASLKSENGVNDFLLNQLKSINLCEQSFLAKFIMGKNYTVTDNNIIIYPFDTNQSQKIAVKKALENDLSLIQGPPGTGKTQTILNIVANYVFRDKKVAVLSGNNEATKNVEEKLNKEGYGTLNAVLGNADNIKEFFNQNFSINSSSKVNKNDDIDLDDILEKSRLLDKSLLSKLKIARIRQSIEEYQVEQKFNDAEYSRLNHCVPKVLKNIDFSTKKILSLAGTLELLSKEEITGFFNRIRLFFKYGILKVKDIANNKIDSIDFLKNNYYKVKIKELNVEKYEEENFLEQYDLQQLINYYILLSKNIFKNKVDKILNSYGKYKFSKDNYKYDFNKFVDRYPIVYSTTNAIASCSGKNFLYDCVIIDESSQVDLITAVIAFSVAKRVVLVGDNMQITNVISSDVYTKAKEIFQDSGLPTYYDYTKNNILQCVLKKYPNVQNTLLNEHYRCDPEIIGFCNKRFYNNQLVVQTKHIVGNGVTIIKHGSHNARGRTNQRQIDIIEREIQPQLNSYNVGIVAPYNAQVNLLREKFADKGYIIDTVHKFQGKEADIIILSTVANKIEFYQDEEKIDFINNPNLLNVAISRAKKRIFLLVSEDILNQQGSILKDFSQYQEHYCSEAKITSTSVYSVFDLMYDDYAPILENLNLQLLNISKYKSENIIGTIINNICNEGKYGALKYKNNYPLKYIIKPSVFETIEDEKFVMNINTHCDFVIYNNLNKEILLIIEVDGPQHNEEPQKSRDLRKDRLLTKAGIKILRLSTTSLDCEEKIVKNLANV